MNHLVLTIALAALPPQQSPPANPAIDAAGHIAATRAAAEHRAARRLTEADFLRISREPGVVVLDARSKAMYDRLHVAGATNLSFPDLDVASLAEAIPDKDTRVLIYCNNNFQGAPVVFAPKRAAVSLNLSTYTTLYEHGYRNVYELAPLLDVKTTRLPLTGTDAEALRSER